MRDLLAKERNHPFIRPALQQGPSSHHIYLSPSKLQSKFYSNRNSEEFPPGTQTPNALRATKSARTRKRIKSAGNYVVRKIKEDNVKKEEVIAALRYSIQMQKKDARRQCRKTEDSMFNDILRALRDLDKKLQEIVNKVREIEPNSKVVMREDGYGLTRGTPLSHLPLQNGNSSRNSGLRAGSSKPGAIHREFVAPPSPQRAGSWTASMPPIGPAIRRASEVLNNLWPLTNRAKSTPEHAPCWEPRTARYSNHLREKRPHTKRFSAGNLEIQPKTHTLKDQCCDQAASTD